MSEPATDNLEALRRQLKRLVEGEKDRTPSKGREKRRHERHLYMVEAAIRYVKRFDQLSSCPNEFVVYTKDISRSGLSFLYEHEMYAGEVIEVTVTAKEITRAFLVRIIRCRRAGLKVFSIAGQFVTPEEAEKSQPGVETESDAAEADQAIDDNGEQADDEDDVEPVDESGEQSDDESDDES